MALHHDIPLTNTVFDHLRTWQLQEIGFLSCVVAEVDQRISGRGLVLWQGHRLPQLEQHYSGVPVIREMYVRADERSRGVASAILHAIEALAVSRGHSGLSLGVAPDNTRAKALWERHGYRHHGPPLVRIVSTYETGRDSVYRRLESFIPMRKDLNPAAIVSERPLGMAG
jgi:GNAT superfamily N-acetyltransferase